MPPASNESFQAAVLHKALADYSDHVGIELEKHPFIDELRVCASPDDVLKLFEDKMKGFKVDRYGNCKLANWLSPVVKVIHALSGVLGEAVAPFQPTKAIFVGMDVLITATDGVGPSYDALVDLFECIGNSLQRLRICTNIPLTPSMTDVFINIVVELLSVFALATKQIKQGRLKKFAKKLLGESKIEVVLQRLDRLTQEGAARWQTLEMVHGLVNNPKVVNNDGKALPDGMQAALDIVQELARQRRDAEIIWERQAEMLRQQAEIAKREIEVAKREIEVQRAEHEAQLKEREARLKEAELLLKEDVLRKEQEALRMEEDARRTMLVTRWREEQPPEHEKGRRAAEGSEGWMGTKKVVVSAWGKLKGRIARVDKQDMARILQNKVKNKFNRNNISVGSSLSINANTDPEVSTLSTVQIPSHVKAEQRRSTSVTSAKSKVENMAITGEDQEELGSVSQVVNSEHGTSAEPSAEYTVRSIISYEERVHWSPEYLHHVTHHA